MDEPITLSEAKQQLRIDGNADDATINRLIATAREWVEGVTGVLLAEREVTETLPAFGPRNALRSRPINGAEPIVVEYIDRTGGSQTITDARIVNGEQILASGGPVLLHPAIGARWPCADGRYPVSVTFTAGINDADKIPAVLRQAVLLLITAYEADREGGDIVAKAEASARRLCRRYIRKTL